MLNEVFSNHYAELYDSIYSDKNYVDECNTIELIFSEYGSGKVENILDLECGTANHALILAKRKYNLVGVDRSVEMIQIAKDKCKNFHNIELQNKDILEYKSSKSFDAVIMMFAVLGYLNKNELVQNTINLVSEKLVKGGLFVFDFWYAPAVLNQRPTSRLKKIKRNDELILRYAEPVLDLYNNCCEVKYTTLVLQQDKVLDNFEETHIVRFFFPREIELFLNINNMELLDLMAFPDIQRSPSEDSWNVVCVAKKKK